MIDIVLREFFITIFNSEPYRADIAFYYDLHRALMKVIRNQCGKESDLHQKFYPLDGKPSTIRSYAMLPLEFEPRNGLNETVVRMVFSSCDEAGFSFEDLKLIATLFELHLSQAISDHSESKTWLTTISSISESHRLFTTHPDLTEGHYCGIDWITPFWSEMLNDLVLPREIGRFGLFNRVLRRSGLKPIALPLWPHVCLPILQRLLEFMRFYRLEKTPEFAEILDIYRAIKDDYRSWPLIIPDTIGLYSESIDHQRKKGVMYKKGIVGKCLLYGQISTRLQELIWTASKIGIGSGVTSYGMGSFLLWKGKQPDEENLDSLD